MAAEMKAWQMPTPGPFEQHLKLNGTVVRPQQKDLKPTQILVRVVSACLNPADYKVPGLGTVARVAIAFPKTLGMDGSGQVLAVGRAVTDIIVGDHVMIRLDPLKRPGTLSECVVVDRAGYAKLSLKTDLDAAAAFPTAALTGYQTIKPYVKAGDKVFINGGSGGTGTFGIQIAKLLGCHVTTSCSTPKVELCKSLGADEIIDYKSQDVVEELTKMGQVFNLVVDNVGSSPPRLHAKSAAFMLPAGTFVMVGGKPSLQDIVDKADAMLRPAFLGGSKNKIVTYLTANKYEDLNVLAGWLEEGKLAAKIETTFEMEETVAAYQLLAKGSTAGKIVVHVGDKQ